MSAIERVNGCVSRWADECVCVCVCVLLFVAVCRCERQREFETIFGSMSLVSVFVKCIKPANK